MLMAVNSPSRRNHFGLVNPFKVWINFIILIFEGKINEDGFKKWLNLLKGYSSNQKNSNNKKMAFTLFKALPHVKDWLDSSRKRHVKYESKIYRT